MNEDPKVKYRDVMIAWLDGKAIQYNVTTHRAWTDWDDSGPPLIDQYEWRIKPEPKPDIIFNRNVYLMETTSGAYPVWVEFEANLQLIFDGETHKLKKVELIEQTNQE